MERDHCCQFYAGEEFSCSASSLMHGITLQSGENL